MAFGPDFIMLLAIILLALVLLGLVIYGAALHLLGVARLREIASETRSRA